MANPTHKRKVVKPQLVGASTVASVSHTTHDQRRVRIRTTVVDNAPPPLAQSDWWAEDLTTNLARGSDAFSYQLGDSSLEAQPDYVADDGITVVVKPARNTNSDRPLQNWYVKNDEYVEESLRREGRGLPKTYAHCASSRVVDPSRPHTDHKCQGVAENGSVIILSASATGYSSWDSACNWDTRRGVICPYRQAAAHDFVLFDVTGVHELNVDFCGCRTGTDNEEPPLERRIQLLRACWWPATITSPNTCATFTVLRLFQKLNCLGKLSAYDFLRGLEMCTNHDGLDKPPDRRRPFMHIMRQWREVKRQKRGKRGHSAGGTRATKQGELAMQCRACPQPGWNLPDNWEEVDPLYRFIYFLFLATDANFRLSNRSVSSEALDPIMGDGVGYFCKRHGDDGYYAHVSKHADETEVSNCSGFQAMSLANTKRTKGLRSTGVAGVTCSRHNMWRANGIGDLQVGERQCNMDFVLLAALIGLRLLWLIISYDIACQFAINFWSRMMQLPAHMQLAIQQKDVWWKVPNFHLPDHKPKCHSPYSFHWMWGAGMTNGEGVEQNWAFSNGAAASTRLMGPGSRQATLEDIFGFHNYDRLLAMHRVLPKRLAVAIKEGTAHAVSFDAFTKGLEEARPDQVKKWRDGVDRWEAVQHTTPEDSPFDLKDEVRTLRDIQLQIATEEFVCAGDGVEVERDHTPGAFIVMGLEIEDVQRKLTVDVNALKEPTATQKLNFTRRHTVLLKRIHKFRQIQRVYMPSVRGVLSDLQKQVFDGNGEQLPEATRLFMPSELADAGIRRRVCALGLPELEARMRDGEATEALEAVRTGLRTRTMTNRYKLRNYTGQGLMTRGQGILRQINIRIHIAKLRYRYSRAALLALRGHGAWEMRLRVLADDDIRALNERALTDEEKAQNEHWAQIGGAFIEGGIARAAGVARGEGTHTLSWIWYSVGVEEGENDRCVWNGAKLWHERGDIRKRCGYCGREMRRTIAYGRTAATEWEKLAVEELPGASLELTEGRRAYAAEQAATEHARCADLEQRWRAILARADAYLDGETGAASESVEVEVEMADELDPDEEEARLEGEDEGDSV
ncbi:CxC2 domain-containing protein [Mycena sanguinolenta]|uniref:CxC2 domain-containing protein n=1 Tax=Mycena sanguinolenta TaxID=230812 RepID=A0A8H7CCQ6_9AGAR|nr:CxC2 domain-containing protein [Mycena sanguinolenta]